MNTLTDTLTTRRIKEIIRSGPFAWPGGYPLYFITSDGEAISFEAVRENWREVCHAVRNGWDCGWRVVACEVNWENPDLYCIHTGDRIESAYSEA